MAFWKGKQNSASYLSGVGFFEGFSSDEIDQVSRLGKEVEVAAGVEIMDQGKVGQTCYVICEGAASVYVGGEHIASLDEGSMVGEMALIDHRPRSATVVADSDMKLLAFETDQFKTLLDTMPKVSQKVMGILNARLRRQNLN